MASSIWRPKFRKALDKYPTFECVPLDISVPFCDACHLNGRLSTLLGRLGGVSYNKIGFTNNVGFPLLCSVVPPINRALDSK